ncbi:MAG: bifunctional riboflavin kinase/FAD synthetase [Alphaproteobacteria bacterium]|nr:bifunctional riboflavin kinase/FAD synthetase [Alphaproteobacteria bacterium]
MRIFRDEDALPAEAKGSVAALGNFDGVHLGHRAVIARAGALARARKAPLAVVTFEPHPRRHFQPEAAPFRLTPLDAKARALAALGIDHLFVLRFGAALAQLGAAAFVSEVLIGRLDLACAVTGYNFSFGKGREGDAAALATLGAPHGLAVERVAPEMDPDGEVCSSSRVRALLAEGQVRCAAALLGREFEIEGVVATGARLGNTIGFPTANLCLGEYARPALGVYAVRCAVDDGGPARWIAGAANIGKRPTVGGAEERLEAHLFDFSGDLYGKRLRVALVEHLRPERKFDGLDALKAQIAEDCRRARALLGAQPARAAS